MKKMLAMLMALVMALSMVPTVWASETTECSGDDSCTHLASIDTTHYDTLAEAINAVPENGAATITVLKDITQESSIGITGGRSLIIDLNNHTIGFTQDRRFQVFLGASLEFTGTGTVKENTPWVSPLVIKGKEPDNTHPVSVIIGENVTMEGFYALMIDKNTSGWTNYDMTVEVNGKLVGKTDGYDPGAAIYINGSVNNTTQYPKITIGNTASLTADGLGIYAAGYATWDVTGGEMEAPGGAIAIKSGTLNISGDATLRATGPDDTPTTGWSNGVHTSGAAIQIESNASYAGDVSVNITGGNITSDNGYAIYSYRNGIDANTNAAYADGRLDPTAITSVSINGGTFSVGKNVILCDSTEAGLYSITGGTFSTDPTAYVPADYIATKNSDNTYTVAVLSDENAVAKIGTTLYKTLTEAFADGGNVVMLKDIDLNERLTVASGKTVSLDLAGHTLTLPTMDMNIPAAILNEGTLTIEDSSGNNEGKIVSDRAVIQNWGILTVESGYLKGAAFGGMSVISNGFVDQSGTNREGTQTATINGGILEGSLPFMNDGEAVIVTGGTFIGAGSENVDNMIRARHGKVTISGGTFNVGGIEAVEDATISITGGTYSTDPTAYVADGYVALMNTDGKFIVSKKTSTEEPTVNGNTSFNPAVPDVTVSESITDDAAKQEAESLAATDTTANVPTAVQNDKAVSDHIALMTQNDPAAIVVLTPVLEKEVTGVQMDPENQNVTEVSFEVTASLSIQVTIEDVTSHGNVSLENTNQRVTFTLPVPSAWNNNLVYIVHESSSGKIYQSSVAKNCLVQVTTTNGFSPFTLSIEKPADYPSGGGGGYAPQGHMVTSPFAGIDKVYVDGSLVKDDNYIVYGGNVLLKQSYMDGLKAGTHTVKIVYGDRQSTGTFTTKGTGTVQSAKTFDAGVAVYGMMALASAAGAVYVTKKR